MTSDAPRTAPSKSKFWQFIDDRLGLNALDYSIPKHGNTLPYMLGGITFFAFVILILTGLYLTLFYDPNPATANASVRSIMTDVPLGSFVRSVHFWTAQAVVISVVLHMVRVFITASYKRPRELNWIVGVLLFAVTMMFFFSGTVLKWDEESFQGVAEIKEISHFLGPLGWPLSPELAPSVPMLARMYAIHIAILPLAMGAIVLAHLLYVHHFNISPLPWRKKRKPEEKEEPKEPFTVHLMGIVKYGLVLFAVLAVLSVAFPAPLGPAPMEGIKDATLPLWPLLPLTAIDDLIGLWWIIPASVVPFLFLLAVPFIDRNDELDPRRRKVIVLLFVLGMAVFLALMLFGITLAPGRALAGG
jgi:quinol-cytochrome oxidoreductase complex cytochrome b subunit